MSTSRLGLQIHCPERARSVTSLFEYTQFSCLPRKYRRGHQQKQKLTLFLYIFSICFSFLFYDCMIDLPFFCKWRCATYASVKRKRKKFFPEIVIRAGFSFKQAGACAGPTPRQANRKFCLWATNKEKKKNRMVGVLICCCSCCQARTHRSIGR